MAAQGLEGPGSKEAPDWASLYLARGDEVSRSRPIFTGDIFEDVQVNCGSAESRITALVLQHPCALRVDGVALVPRLLVAKISNSSLVRFGGWKGNYKIMPLPELSGKQDHFVAHFQEPYLVDAEVLQRSNRIACMSQIGVNLLLQRWVHHNSRAIVPTFDYQAVTEAQLEETDLIEEWCDERVADSKEEIDVEMAAAHDWLRQNSHNPEKRWQDLLAEPQTRSIVRKAMRSHLKEFDKEN